jgi:hypothetical protein
MTAKLDLYSLFSTIHRPESAAGRRRYSHVDRGNSAASRRFAGTRRAFAAFALSLFSLGVIGAHPAAAASLSTAGTPGSNQTWKVDGYANPWGGNLPLIEMRSNTVTRSPATSGTQLIYLRYRLFSLNSGVLVKVAERTFSASVPYGFRWQVPTWDVQGSWLTAYRIDMTITWATISNSFIGQRYINYSSSPASGDYECITGSPWSCYPLTVGGTGYIWFEA